MAPSQPATSTVPVPLLTKFVPHPSSVSGPSSTIASWVSSHPSPSREDLEGLRLVIQTARDGAAQRLLIRETNKAVLVQRQVRDKALVEEQARLKDAERRRKREEDDRREKDRHEREERDRLRAELPAREEGDDDVEMDDVKLEPGAEDHHKPLSSAIAVGSSPEPDEDRQPRPPKHKIADPKKRKRDQVVDSDDNSDSEEDNDVPLAQKATQKQQNKSHGAPHRPTPSGSRQASLAPSVSVALPEPPLVADPLDGLTPLERKLREDRFMKHSIPIKAAPPGAAVNFHLPLQTLVPIKPPSIPPPSTAKKQSEVAEDFSKAKPGSQIAFSTFHTFAENYLRPFGEDDLAFLAPTPHDPGLYAMPALGKHYLEKWEEEDADPPQLNAPAQYSALEPPPLTRFRPDAISEDTLAAESVFLGPLSERLVAAMVFEEGGDNGELEEQVEDDDDEGPPPTKILDAVDLEDRIKKELRFIGILSEDEVQWSAREDDEVSSALRACQRLLHRQSGINEARKAILSDIVKDRMGYQEYEATRDAQERVIEQGWQKRQRSGKKKGKAKDKDKPVEGGAKQPVSIALLQAVEKRARLVGKFRQFFEDEEDKERWVGMPSASIYEGLDGEDVPLD